MFCRKCGTYMQTPGYCPKCHTLNQETSAGSADNFSKNFEIVQAQENLICPECGAPVNKFLSACPECGARFEPQEEEGPKLSETKFNKKILIIIAVCAMLLVVLIPIAFFKNNISVSSVKLDKEKITMKTDTEKELSALILPEDSSNKELTWSSDDESVAKVDESGKISAVGIGTCYITVSSVNDKTAKCFVKVESPGHNFDEAIQKYSKEKFFESAKDESWIKIDTNPKDKDDVMLDGSTSAIKVINKELDLPESVFTDMQNTKSADGVIKKKYDDVSVEWSYSPGKGLEIKYEIRK